MYIHIYTHIHICTYSICVCIFTCTNSHLIDPTGLPITKTREVNKEPRLLESKDSTASHGSLLWMPNRHPYILTICHMAVSNN